MDLGASTSIPCVIDGQNQTVALKLEDGETLNVDSQIQFYAPNDLLYHPLISHCRAYLGGLPPLFFIAGDKEVLRDEIIYTWVSSLPSFTFVTESKPRAHRAANPSKFPISPEAKHLYPRIMEYAAKYPTPTKVHLQVYDGCAHVLPILFAFTTPAKYCFRAIASFCRFVTGMQAYTPGPPSPTAPNAPGSPLRRSFFGGSFFTTPPEEVGDFSPENRRRKSWWGGDSAPLRRASRKTGKDKQRSHKAMSSEEPTTEQEETSEGQSHGEDDQVERRETKVEHHGFGEVEKNLTRTGVVIDGEVVGNGSFNVGGDETGEVRTVDEVLEVQTAKVTEAGDSTTRSLKEAKSLRSLNSNKSSKDSQGSTGFKKRWTLKIGKRPAPEIQIPVLGKRLTEDVAGSRFETAKEPQGERCAGDYPPVYRDGFVSSISPHINLL